MTTGAGTTLSRRLTHRVATFARCLLFVVCAVFATLAAIENTEPVRLSLLGYQTSELSLFWWLLSALFLGFLVGCLTKSGRS